MQLKYRPDIDGLRAIAVLPVLLFHMDIYPFSGGFVGVDIFFVISGYLITSIIVREIENGDFSITKFYERRFRRIFPALTVVMLLSFAAGAYLFNSSQFRDLGQSVVATSLFSSNILFYMESGYFDAPSELKPLLHTWSLAVEEQYYIFFPLLLLFIAKYNSKKYIKWLVPLGLISLSACIAGMELNPSATFYLILTRAWELLIGSVLAIHIFPKVKHQIICDILSIIGFILICISVFLYSPSTNFPGIAATIPTIGAALIIYSGNGKESFIGKILSIKPIVFIGLISYSLYLWHWPVIVYTKYYAIKELSNIEIGLMFCVITVLSILSWHYIEKPFRKKKYFIERKTLFKAVSVVSIITICCGLLVYLENGFPSRFNNDELKGVNFNDYKWAHWKTCENVEQKLRNNEGLCHVGSKRKQIDFFLWGDSHARALATSIDLSAKRYGLTGNIATQSACPPLISIDPSNRPLCHNFNQVVLEYISSKPTIKTVLLAARWPIYANGSRYKRETGKPTKLIDIKSSDVTEKPNRIWLQIGLKRTIDSLQKLGKTVILVKSIPEIGYHVPSANFIAKLTGRDISSIIAPSVSEYLQRNEIVTSIFTLLKKETSATSIDLSKYLCDDSHCKVIINNTLLYRDEDHLSTFGSEFVSPLFDSIFSVASSK